MRHQTLITHQLRGSELLLPKKPKVTFVALRHDKGPSLMNTLIKQCKQIIYFFGGGQQRSYFPTHFVPFFEVPFPHHSRGFSSRASIKCYVNICPTDRCNICPTLADRCSCICYFNLTTTEDVIIPYFYKDSETTSSLPNHSKLGSEHIHTLSLRKVNLNKVN